MVHMPLQGLAIVILKQEKFLFLTLKKIPIIDIDQAM